MIADGVIEEVVTFHCAQSRLWGVLSRPSSPTIESTTAVLIVVGGPQYRVGSHRMFVSLARALAAAGYPVLRYDQRGMGDSEGELRDFAAGEPDLRAALDALQAARPATQRIVVWGLCDGASAALMFATGDPRVRGIVAVNPWARSAKTLAATRVKHYYASRLLQRDFWTKLLSGGLRWRESLRSIARDVARARSGDQAGGAAFQVVMADGLRRFPGRLLLVLSGNDLTAREFLEFAGASAAWEGLLKNNKVHRVDLVDADHTFSHQQWLDAVVTETTEWLNRLSSTSGGGTVPTLHAESAP